PRGTPDRARSVPPPARHGRSPRRRARRGAGREGAPLPLPYPLVHVTGLAKSYGARTLFEGVSFRLDPGERLAVVGRNGTGKTTGVGCWAARGPPAGGGGVPPGGARLPLPAQPPPLGRDLTLGEYVAEGLAGHRDIERRLAELEARMAAGDHG